ncbi:WXG100 family type VII secretion target [Streptomyces sp. CAI-24]|uniref:WXG100 family type VII secretion target n=1 Tax=Streptomyces sp. CAI-24 TaxID=2712892 RepID=UPI0035CB9284
MPGEDRITVNFATLQQLSGDLEDILRVLNKRLDTLYGRAAKAVLSWDGEAREAFIDELDKWSPPPTTSRRPRLGFTRSWCRAT